MPLPVGFKWASGKSAMMGSLADYLTTNISDEYFDFDNPILPVKLPGYGVMERGLYNIAPVAFENFLGYQWMSGYSGYSGVSGLSGWSSYSGYSNWNPLYGRRNQTLVEINAWDDETAHSNAVGKVRQMRDKVIYLLYNAGRTNDAGGFVMPPIKLYDYSVVPKVEIGIIQVDPSDNAINERLMIDPINQNIKVYRMLVRLYWYEYL